MRMIRLPRGAHLWGPAYLTQALTPKRSPSGPIDILLSIADHFEPAHGQPGPGVELARIRTWQHALPQLCEAFADSDGRPPQHTFFYPIETYCEEHLEAIGDLCAQGLGEVEVHLHHDNDCPSSLRRRLVEVTARLDEAHGLLSRDEHGRPAYAFVHGNWALANSRPDGRCCGVDGELTILRETGCYADFTMPSAPDETQTRTINRIYYAIDDPPRFKPHDTGPRARANTAAPRNGLLMVQGPLAVSWRRSATGRRPSLENGQIDATTPPTLDRFIDWLSADVHVADRPEWVFVKLHTHGAVERNSRVLLGDAMHRFHESILSRFNDGRCYRLHYVSAREMVNIARAAEAGHSGNAGLFRDFVFPPPQRIAGGAAFERRLA